MVATEPLAVTCTTAHARTRPLDIEQRCDERGRRDAARGTNLGEAVRRRVRASRSLQHHVRDRAHRLNRGAVVLHAADLK
jgi:hypothetical protein